MQTSLQNSWTANSSMGEEYILAKIYFIYTYDGINRYALEVLDLVVPLRIQIQLRQGGFQ